MYGRSNELLSNTLGYTDYDGTFMNKSQFLASVKDTTDKPEQIVNENVTVQVYGGSAVVAGSYHEKGTSRGNRISGTGGSRTPESTRMGLGSAWPVSPP